MSNKAAIFCFVFGIMVFAITCEGFYLDNNDSDETYRLESLLRKRFQKREGCDDDRLNVGEKCGTHYECCSSYCAGGTCKPCGDVTNCLYCNRGDVLGPKCPVVGSTIPWSNVERDEDVAERIRNGELLSQPSNCSQPYWSIIKRTWSILPEDRPTFNELKHLLSEQYYRSEGNSSQNVNRLNSTKTTYDATARQRQIVQRQHQEEQDRRIAQRYQDEERLRTTTSMGKINCGGSVCSKCGKCRDWYLNGRIPRKRRNGSCTAYKIDILTAFQTFASGITTDMRPLEENHMCQCIDNRN
ncbi:hypothetical protein I4U23_004978 [Adineta vaga]|nr:hypothetical protein I4U23_004978 [Adineta vaga]